MAEQITKCGCTGIRTCLVCSKKWNETKVDHNTLKFWYCPGCQLTFKGDITVVQSWCELHRGVLPSDIVTGISVYEDFLNTEEEEFLLKEIYKDEWKLSQSGRRKQDFGPKPNFKRRKVKIGLFTGFPSYSKFLVERMKNMASLANFEAVELCNLEYTPERGSSIDPHIDDMWLWGDQLVTVNLKSRTILTLSKPGAETSVRINDDCSSDVMNNSKNVEVQIPMSPRSLLILENEARTTWLHGIRPCHILEKRVAMTFRNLSAEIENDVKYDEVRVELLRLSGSFDGKVAM